ncbi:hypothetical protein EVG20_g2385 [Dentipellis fragilis]|uniref:snRNA-activating protein complex subunit 3 n=1 Tax=Dentipellis fragilis TaxID=205917 RepID=A0A4Y9Z9Y6_9AGAM|nr:hypothetical protein EVG20_g2385 [Dentipellis fragilis]
MNAGTSFAHESHFGPPSELININEFLQAALESRSAGQETLFDDDEEFPNCFLGILSRDAPTSDDATTVAEECSIDDLKATLTTTLLNPRLAAHTRTSHEASISTIYTVADSNASNRRKRKRDAATNSQENPELTEFKNKLDNIRLQSWPITQDAASFIRGPKNSDLNALSEIKMLGSGTAAPLHGAIITVSIHNRISWSHNYLTRFSQHAVLSTQTLDDLFEAIPCPSNELPEEIMEDNEVSGYKPHTEDSMPALSGCAVCIEDVVYGDGLSERDYADKLISSVTNPLQKGSTMHDTLFSSLTLRLNEPYWLLHQGNCEHFLVVEQIRLLNSDDPTTGYPLTLQITPPLLDLCRACSKVPAVYSIVGDVRLGESPCLLCAPCWRHMGLPKDEEASQVVVVTLPRHELGW